MKKICKVRCVDVSEHAEAFRHPEAGYTASVSFCETFDPLLPGKAAPYSYITILITDKGIASQFIKNKYYFVSLDLVDKLE